MRRWGRYGLNNERQHALSTNIYATEHQDQLPWTNWDGGSPTAWDGAGWLYDARVGPLEDWRVHDGLLYPYVGTAEIWRCPADDAPADAVGVRRITSYVMNGSISGFSTEPPAKIFQFDSKHAMYWELDEEGTGGYWNDGSNQPDEVTSTRHSGAGHGGLLRRPRSEGPAGHLDRLGKRRPRADVVRPRPAHRRAVVTLLTKPRPRLLTPARGLISTTTAATPARFSPTSSHSTTGDIPAAGPRSTVPDPRPAGCKIQHLTAAHSTRRPRGGSGVGGGGGRRRRVSRWRLTQQVLQQVAGRSIRRRPLAHLLPLPLSWAATPRPRLAPLTLTRHAPQFPSQLLLGPPRHPPWWETAAPGRSAHPPR